MSVLLQHDIAQLIEQNRRLAEQVERLQMERHELTLKLTTIQAHVASAYALITREQPDARQHFDV